MKVRFLGVLLAATAASVLPLAAQVDEDCRVRFEPVSALAWNATAGGAYDPIDPFEHRQRAELSVRSELGQCRFAIGFAAPASVVERQLVGERDALAYRLVSLAGQPLRDLAETSSPGDLLSGVVAAGGFAVADFEWVLPAAQAVAPGRYDSSVELRLYAGSRDDLRLVDTATLALGVEVRAALELRLPLAEWWLGDLARGGSRVVDLALVGNVGARLIVESANRGRLLSVDLGEVSVVPYSLRLDGEGTAVEAGRWERRLPPPEGLLGTIAVEVVPGSAAGAAAGDYADTLTFTVAAE